MLSVGASKHIVLMTISQIPALPGASKWKTRNDVAKNTDQQDLNAKLDDLEANHLKFTKAFGN